MILKAHLPNFIPTLTRCYQVQECTLCFQLNPFFLINCQPFGKWSCSFWQFTDNICKQFSRADSISKYYFPCVWHYGLFCFPKNSILGTIICKLPTFSAALHGAPYHDHQVHDIRMLSQNCSSHDNCHQTQ